MRGRVCSGLWLLPISVGCGHIGIEYLSGEEVAVKEDSVLAAGGSAGAGGDRPAVVSAGGSGGTAGGCEEWPDLPGTVAAYLYGYHLLTSAWPGAPSLELMGGDAPALVPGPSACGRALRFGERAGYYVIASDPAWQLEVGSIDFWYFPRSCGVDLNVVEGILSRESKDKVLGQIGIYWGDCLIRVSARADETVSAEVEVPLTLDAWHHLGVNFGAGGLELWVDGTLAGKRVGFTSGIAGNTLPWALGAGPPGSSDGSLAASTQRLRSGDVSLVRISATRRDFGGLLP